jgi:nucleotidyltransferase/DNA polymerase involved in DNA repair
MRIFFSEVSSTQALFEATDNNPLERVRPCDVQKIINSLKLRKAHGIGGILNFLESH